ncbi:MAG: glycosyltransferase, partial [bacterium]|nr:glycosyltransferase [bacterium]
ENTITSTIESLQDLDYPQDKLDIIIVDDGSTDKTLSLAKKFDQELNIKVLTKPNGGKFTALNMGIEHSTTEFVGGLDADSFVDPSALKELVAHFDDPMTMAVTPAIKVHKTTNTLQYIQKAEYGLSIFYRAMFGLMGALFITPGPFSIYRKGVFDRIGMFRHAHNTEDMEMAMRMQRHHMKIENVHAAHVYTVVPCTLRALIKQRVRWVQGFLQNCIDYRDLIGKSKYGNLGLFILPISIFSIFGAIIFMGLTLSIFARQIIDKIIEIQAIGFYNTFVHAPKFDWFFYNTNTNSFLITFLFAITISLIFIGKRLARESITFRDIIVYLLFYSFLAPLWLTKAVYNTIFAKNVNWK